jgi:arginyl-tRNA synthetase
VITGALEQELTRLAGLLLPGQQAQARQAPIPAAATLRPGRGGDPASYSTSLGCELARLTRRAPADIAAALADGLRVHSWIQLAEPAASGFVTITVTPQALAASAAQMAAAGPACAASTMLRAATVAPAAWPDLATAPSWQRAWQDQAGAITSRLSVAAGATTLSGPERAGLPAGQVRTSRSPVATAVDYFGVSSVRYRLARTPPAGLPRLQRLVPSAAARADPLYPVQQAHAAAASTLRWAADLRVGTEDPGERLAGLLGAPAERALLGLLSWLPVRVAAAARRGRPDELTRYLEVVCASWLACRLACPALPFGGAAAPRDPLVASARLVLADAVRAVLAAGLGLAGIAAADRL